MRRSLLLVPLLLTSAFAAGPQDFLPPAPPWSGASEALIAKPDNPWITPSEKTGLTDSPTYEKLTVHVNTKPGVELRRPKAYWISPAQSEIIERLKVHGVELQANTRAMTETVEMYRLVDPKPAEKPFEGRQLVTTKVKAETRTETFPAGSVRVPTDQPLGDLIVALLEPESGD